MSSKDTHRRRSSSFALIDECQASGILTDVLSENHVYLGGSSLGKGLTKAARHYLKKQMTTAKRPNHFNLPGAAEIVPNAELMPLEESFYVLDLGVVVSQVYQWRRFFPRVEPFYAVKCNPDPVIIKTLAILGCNFDCASRNEFRLVHELTADLPRKPEIIFANPCKPRSHVIEAVCKGIRMVTFDNAFEIEKCAKISKSIELVLRIITDDRGSVCRLSSKFGAPRSKWESLLSTAQKHGMKVVGVSFHVGSGCRDASRYEAALSDAKEIFELAETKFGMKMSLLDIGGGFPGETHSLWNPAEHIDNDDDVDDVLVDDEEKEDHSEDRFMFFTEIAEQVAPVLDRIFPAECGVRIIGEPGRYFVAAAATLCCSVVSARFNSAEEGHKPERLLDSEYSQKLNELSREEEIEVVRHNKMTMTTKESDDILLTIQEELVGFSKLYANTQMVGQEVDVYTDKLDLYNEGLISAVDQLGPPLEHQMSKQLHTVEGMNYQLVTSTDEDASVDPHGLLTLAAAGEAAVKGVVIQAVADSAPFQDDYAYYISDGVYGAFNNIMFDHAVCRPRVLRTKYLGQDGGINRQGSSEGCSSGDELHKDRHFYSSTIFGPTCDSIDVICRSVLLPELQVGDWLYFNNMGAYTMAAASSFNGFTPSEKFYVCSVMPEYFEAMIAGPDAAAAKVEELCDPLNNQTLSGKGEEKKED